MSNTHTDSFLTASSMAVMLSRWQVLQAGRKTPISWLWTDPLLWSRCLQVWVTQWQQIPGSDEFMFYFCANCSLFQSDTFHSMMSYHSKTLDTFKDQTICAGLSLVPALCTRRTLSSAIFVSRFSVAQHACWEQCLLDTHSFCVDVLKCMFVGF